MNTHPIIFSADYAASESRMSDVGRIQNSSAARRGSDTLQVVGSSLVSSEDTGNQDTSLRSIEDVRGPLTANAGSED